MAGGNEGTSEPLSIQVPPEARCPEHGEKLSLRGAEKTGDEGRLRGSCGCVFTIRNGIPRFVPDTTYADAFGIQWNAFRQTQLDSYTGTTISKDRLVRCLGGSLEVVRGASVLEVGCGAGRFTEILLDAGARVFACDLSGAVDANLANCGGKARYFVCQANALSLPVASAAFDFVIALGMIQHTPSPEATIAALARAVKPGGQLVVDHYTISSPLLRLIYPLTIRAALRGILVRMPPADAFRATDRLVRILLPIHQALWREGAGAGAVRRVWRLVSPVFDYYDSYPELGHHLGEWALLDTHDAMTDRYKHFRTPAQIAGALETAGLRVIESRPGGNGVEARAQRPLSTTVSVPARS